MCSIAAVLVSLQSGSPSLRAQAPGSHGIIRGRVVAPSVDLMESLRRGKKMQRYDTHSHAGEPIEPYRLSEVSVVYLEEVPASIPAQPPRLNPKLNQYQMVFRPLVLPIVAGTTVDFPNEDPLFHNVFSYSEPREFDLGRYPRGEKKSVTFNRPGIVKVYCDIHSYMYATILVLKNPFFALPDDDGSYAITDIPPGEYHLTFWYGRNKAGTKMVSVKDGTATTVNFP